MNNTEEEILKQLKDNPQHAMELVVEQYTGLVWKIAGTYLQAPEDIKDCLQDTFAEFYEKWENFSPAKGTLASYIGVISRNRAISRYRKNKIRTTDELSQEIAGNDTAFETLENRIDIEKAIAALNPEETEIIRMKYYCGMTIPEIADALKLPYETVKKRHQRSLKKMRILLTILLVLMLLTALTACGYWLLRYFGIIPGYGISYDSNIPIYGLAETNVYNDAHYSYQIQDGNLWEGTLSLTICVKNLENGQPPFTETDTFNNSLQDLSSCFQLYCCGQIYSAHACYLVVEEAGMPYINLQFELPALSREEQTFAMTLYFFDMEMPFVMNQVQEEMIEKYGYHFDIYGGLIAVPHWSEERLSVGIYPVSLRDDASINPRLVYGMPLDSMRGEITLTSQDGTVLTGEPIYSPDASQKYYDWDFGAAPEGDYMLHIPYVYLSMPLPETDAVSLNPKCREWEGTFFDVPGGTLSIVSYEPLTAAQTSQYEKIIGMELPATYNYWLMKLHYEHITNETLWLSSPCLQLDYIQLPDEEYQMLDYSSTLFRDEEDQDNFHMLIRISPSMDLEKFELKLTDQASVRWMQPFDIPVNAESSQ